MQVSSPSWMLLYSFILVNFLRPLLGWLHSLWVALSPAWSYDSSLAVWQPWLGNLCEAQPKSWPIGSSIPECGTQIVSGIWKVSWDFSIGIWNCCTVPVEGFPLWRGFCCRFWWQVHAWKCELKSSKHCIECRIHTIRITSKVLIIEQIIDHNINTIPAMACHHLNPLGENHHSETPTPNDRHPDNHSLLLPLITLLLLKAKRRNIKQEWI